MLTNLHFHARLHHVTLMHAGVLSTLWFLPPELAFPSAGQDR
jgi:hypothetical protein